jgi:hypothetical protein
MASPKRNANRPKFDRKPIDIEDLTNASAFGGIRDVIESHFGKPETSGGPEPADPDAPAADGSAAPPVFETDPDRLEYLWNPKESPISVRLGAELIGRLEKESLDIFRAITNRGSEIGGLLLGRVVQGRPSIVIVEDFEPVACGYTLGPTFLLSGDEQQRMREAISQRKPGDEIQVVGFFRSNTRPVLSMAEEDSVLLDRLFPEDHHIFLLTKPFSRKPCQGAIFVREDRKFQGEASHLEFPFSKAELEKLGQLEPAIRVASGGASRVTPIRPPAPPSAPEPPKPVAMAPPVQSQPEPPKPVAPVIPEPARPAAMAPPVQSQPEPPKPAAPVIPEPARPAAMAPPVQSQPAPQKPVAPVVPELAARPAAMAPPVQSQPAPAAPVRVEQKTETVVQTKIEPKVESAVPPRPVTQVQPKVSPGAPAPARPVWRFKPAVQPPVPPPAPAQPVPPAESAKALRIQPAIKPPVPPAPPVRPVPPPAESAKAPQPPQVQPAAKPPVPPAPPARPVPPPAESAKAPQPPQVQPAAKPPVQPVAAAQPMRPVPPPVESPKAPEAKVQAPAKPPVQPVAAAQPVRPAPPPAEPAKATEQKKSRAESVSEPAPPVEKAVPEFRFGAEDASSPRSRIPLVVGALVVAIVALSLFFLLRPSQPMGAPAPRTPAANAAPQAPALVLLVEAEDSALMVRWDSSNPAIAAASSGSLTFVDGSVRSSVPLSSAELKQGAYKYKPHSNDLAIRLEVSGAPGAPNVFGATRILGAIRMLAPASH